MHKILLFGGTTEGRRLWDFFSRQQVLVDICVATEYGEGVLVEHPRGRILVGRKDCDQMRQLMEAEKYSLAIDATHPYAKEVSQNIHRACQMTGLLVIRLLREEPIAEELLEFASIEEAVAYLKQTQGNILVTTGSKELLKYVESPSFLSRLFVRVLPAAAVISQCLSYGLENRQIIAMQGPFSEELNIACIRQWDIKFLITKSSGKAGGFLEKAAAAKKAGARLVVIGRGKTEKGMPEGELIQYVCSRLALPLKRQITLLGSGMGNGTLTEEGRQALLEADVVIGAPRLIQSLPVFQKQTVPLIKAEEIVAYLQANPQYQKPVVAFSGDIGFYSGATKLYPLLEEYDIQGIPGISAPIYFMARLGLPWQDVRLCSIHGNGCTGTDEILKYSKCFFIIGKSDDVSKICQSLVDRGQGHLSMIVGERLSYPEERIVRGTAAELIGKSFDPLSVLLVINPKPSNSRRQMGIADAEFSRFSDVPMTKREIRAIVMHYLQWKDGEVFYDIGAGTGSISIEGALCCPNGTIYAIEYREKAIDLLKGNIEKFGCANITVVNGMAPESLSKLEPPDKVFIGGSEGKLLEILKAVLKKNPYVHVVLNCIALETLSKALLLFHDLGIAIEEMTQVFIAKGEQAGNVHLMKGQNPIFIISGQGSGKV